jgi:hypothetical protein
MGLVISISHLESLYKCFNETRLSYSSVIDLRGCLHFLSVKFFFMQFLVNKYYNDHVQVNLFYLPFLIKKKKRQDWS